MGTIEPAPRPAASAFRVRKYFSRFLTVETYCAALVGLLVGVGFGRFLIPLRTVEYVDRPVIERVPADFATDRTRRREESPPSPAAQTDWKPPTVLTTYAPPSAAPAAVPPRAVATVAPDRLSQLPPFVVMGRVDYEPPDAIGNIWFTGTVYNASERPAKVQLLAKAIGERGLVINSNSTFPKPYPVPPRFSASFRSYVESRGENVLHITVEPVVE